MANKHELENTISNIKKKRGKTADRCSETLEQVSDYLERRQKPKPFALDPCHEGGSCPCSTPIGGSSPKVDLVVLIDTSGSMSTKASNISEVAQQAIADAQKNCPTDLRIEWFGVGGTWAGTIFNQKYKDYLNGLGITPAPTFFSANHPEEGADATADIATFYDWREDACRSVLYISDEPMDRGSPQDAGDDAATTNAINVCNANNVTVFTHLVGGTGFDSNPGTVANFTDLAKKTNGKATIGGLGTKAQYLTILQDAICNACGGCKEIKVPDIHPCVSVTWGDGKCDSLETDDYEVMSISICNCYSNVTFSGLTIGYIYVTDSKGKIVPVLPDGSLSVEAVPIGPVCFGDIGPCKDGEANCVTREFVLHSRGAKAGKYKLNIGSICYDVTHHYRDEACFEFELCNS